MVEIGFKSLKSDPCVYIYSEGGAIYVLTLSVDDVLLLGKDSRVLERIKRKLMRRFSMTDMGDVSLVLEMEVTRDRTKGTVTIEKEKTPPRIVSYQYRMLGWASIFSLCDTRSGHKYYCSVRPA